jgi:hypothetical protein
MKKVYLLDLYKKHNLPIEDLADAEWGKYARLAFTPLLGMGRSADNQKTYICFPAKDGIYYYSLERRRVHQIASSTFYESQVLYENTKQVAKIRKAVAAYNEQAVKDMQLALTTGEHAPTSCVDSWGNPTLTGNKGRVYVLPESATSTRYIIKATPDIRDLHIKEVGSESLGTPGDYYGSSKVVSAWSNAPSLYWRSGSCLGDVKELAVDTSAKTWRGHEFNRREYEGIYTLGTLVGLAKSSHRSQTYILYRYANGRLFCKAHKGYGGLRKTAFQSVSEERMTAVFTPGENNTIHFFVPDNEVKDLKEELELYQVAGELS